NTSAGSVRSRRGVNSRRSWRRALARARLLIRVPGGYRLVAAHPYIMLPPVTGLPWAEQDLPRDTRNTARETRARFEYQDACVVLRCIPNLLPGSPLIAVVIEWTSDYVALA